ncbi:MAG TPA: aminotransferase class I/II-fold pyridoxal phosphate-dependent enzyme [Planktothrix sp.]
MTQFLTLTPKKKESAKAPTGAVTYTETPDANRLCGLTSSAQRHAAFEVASFHTPGHKGRALSPGLARLSEQVLSHDLTELPGLDDLSAPAGVIAQVEARAANLWGSAHTLISLGGASQGLTASLMAIAANDRRDKVLLPRNAHRSIVHGLILSGLEPIWFEPAWDANWGIWGAVSETAVEKLLSQPIAAECAALYLVSPTYAGAFSDIKAIARKCRQAKITLVVDAAHGAHLLPEFGVPSPAVQHADLTVHSLHKTLCGLTQTGAVHIHRDSAIGVNEMRVGLNLLSSSSPSYPLMMSIEQTVSFLETDEGRTKLSEMGELCSNLAERLRHTHGITLYRSHGGNDPAHLLVRSHCMNSEQLQQELQNERVFSEALLGNGVLLLAGIGSDKEDTHALMKALANINCTHNHEATSEVAAQPAPFGRMQQVLSPRQASLMPSEVVPIEQAVGRIAHECLAPCPPGIPVTIPGQRVHPEVMNIASLRSLRVVKETQ